LIFAVVASVPDVGSVTAVVSETVNVVPKAPLIVKVLAALLATPVPPFAADTVPANVMVPEPVIGPPLAVRPVVPPLTLTLVTVPPPPEVAIQLVTPVPSVDRT
jgi:hypothetical protein